MLQNSRNSRSAESRGLVTVLAERVFLAGVPSAIFSIMASKSGGVTSSGARPVQIRARSSKSGGVSGLTFNDGGSVAAALAGATAAVNAVSLYVERGKETFEAVHVEGAARVARTCREAGAWRLIQVSGIGADPQGQPAHSCWIG